jgi:hypothetical protein
MNAEELKMVLEAITTLSGNAGNAFEWWLIVHYGTKLLALIAVLTGVGMAAFTIYKIVLLLNPPSTTRWDALRNAIIGVWIHGDHLLPQGEAYKLYQQMEAWDRARKHGVKT